MVHQIKMTGIRTDDVHRAIQSAVEGEVGHLRIDPVVDAIVHSDHQQIFLPQIFRQIDPEDGVSAVMVRQLFAIEIDVGRGAGASDLQEAAVRLGKVCPADALSIPPHAPVIVVAAILAVNVVPGVGKIDPDPVGGHLGRAGAILFGKRPFSQQWNYSPHRFLL